LYLTPLDWLRGPGANQAIAGITLPSDASVGCHESLGFQHVAVFSDVGCKFEQWHDVGFWQLALGPSQSATHVRSMAEVDPAEAAQYLRKHHGRPH